MIKTPSHPVLYERERDVYEFDCIRKSDYVRFMDKTIDNGMDQCMAFEWTKHALWSLRHQWRDLSPGFPKTVARSELRALRAIGDMDGQGAGVRTG